MRRLSARREERVGSFEDREYEAAVGAPGTVHRPRAAPDEVARRAGPLVVHERSFQDEALLHPPMAMLGQAGPGGHADQDRLPPRGLPVESLRLHARVLTGLPGDPGDVEVHAPRSLLDNHMPPPNASRYNSSV